MITYNRRVLAAAVSALLLTCPAWAAAAGPVWTSLWQDALQGGQFDPERISVVPFVDRTTGNAFLATWNYGVWESTDGGHTFVRVDNGKVSARSCGPITGFSAYAAPDGDGMAVFNMNNAPGPSGYSLDGGKTWTSFESVGRNWDFGAMDFASKVAFAARHEFNTLHLTVDGGKSWTPLARPRRPVTGVGVVGKALLLATTRGIERSEDEGKTWTKVSDLGAAGPAVRFKDRLWWLSDRRRSVIASADGGKTWAAVGKPAPGPVKLGPIFGKDADHVLLVGQAGFYESTDGCKSWKLAVALPEDYSPYAAAYDPVHDVFYSVIRGKPVMKWYRSAKPDYAVPDVLTDAAGIPAGRPAAKFVEAAQAKIRAHNIYSAGLMGDYLYMGSFDGGIVMKRDLTDGTLRFVEQLPDYRCAGYTMACAGGHAYAVSPHNGYRRMKWHGLAWYDIDPDSGKMSKRGVVACPASRQIIVGPGQKDLYLKAFGRESDKVFWYRLGDDGKPARAGEVTGKGIGPSIHSDYPGIFQMSPDGRFLYTASAEDYCIACIERKADGEIAYKDAVSLEPVAKVLPGNERYLWVSIAISADGRWLYAAVRNGKPTENYYGIFRRDAESGALTFQERFDGEHDPLANLRAWSMVFAPDGSGGYLGSWCGPLVTFKYDPKTGHLLEPMVINATKHRGSTYLVLDPAAGVLYAGAGGGSGYDWVYSMKVSKAP